MPVIVIIGVFMGALFTRGVAYHEVKQYRIEHKIPVHTDADLHLVPGLGESESK